MLYAYRTCGISLGKCFSNTSKGLKTGGLSLGNFKLHKNLSSFCLGHIECIRSESCTDFLTLLFDLFGEDPSQDVLKGVVIDRACDVHPYCKRLGLEGHQACRFYSENLNWIVDPFHIKGHIVSYLVLSINIFVSKIA